jgi:hypothetical protein
MSEKRYISGGSNGWLNVKREPSGQVIALPEYLAVEFLHNKNGRDHFKVSEGVESGKLFSVVQGSLKSGSPAYKSAASLNYNLSKQELTYPGGKVSAVTYDRNPILPGTHPIQIPDFPHQLGASYVSRSRYAKTWFYLGNGVAIPGSNDRYLHTGSMSAGCVTVDPDSWTALYQFLILCRSGNGKTVGSITVVR